MIKRLLKYVKPYTFYAILCPLLMILEVSMDVYIPYLMADIVDVGIQTGDVNFVMQRGMMMILAALIGLGAGIWSAKVGATAGFGFGSNVREAAFSNIQTFSFKNLDKFSVSSLITRLTNDTQRLSNTAMMTLRMGFRAPSMLIFGVFMAMRIDRELAVIFLLAIPILAVLIGLIMKKAFPLFSIMQKKVDRINNVVQENLTSIRVVKSYVRDEYESKRFKERNDDLMESGLKAVSLVIMSMPIMMVIVYSCIIAILWFGGNRILLGTMEAGKLMSFITYVMQILMSLMMLSMFFINLTSTKASAERLLEVIDTKTDIDSPAKGAKEVPNGSIEFKNVDFRYPGNQGDTLEQISVKIESGQTIGVIGSTGSAKTSLIQLIPRLYDITGGELEVGGINVQDYDLETLRDQVAVVLQKNTLFSGTIRSNMLWGDAEATDEEIIHALKISQAWEFVSANPDGLDARVEQGGNNFSGGQKQRLAIARALLRHPKILILDDSTSAVDMGTDAKLRKAFRENLQDVTTIIIAQRIASVEDADRIIVLDDGRIDGIGTADELMETSRIYREVYESQQRGVIAG